MGKRDHEESDEEFVQKETESQSENEGQEVKKGKTKKSKTNEGSSSVLKEDQDGVQYLQVLFLLSSSSY